jgi:hypothetical protein
MASHGRGTQSDHAVVPSQARPSSGQADASDSLWQLQQSVGNRAVVRLMAPLSVQTKSEAPASGDAFEQEADQAADTATRSPMAAATAPPDEGMAPGDSPAAAPQDFVVEDDERRVGPGQLRRTEFLASVRTAVCGTANEGFAGTGRSADDCPWIEHWLGYYESRDAAHLNRSLRKVAPETARAATADAAIAMIAARVRRSVDAYARTGELTGVPDGFSTDIPGASLIGGVFGGMLGGLFGGIAFKRRPGSPSPSPSRSPSPGAATADPQAIRTQLGPGQPLQSDVRSRMDAAFGVTFAHVRTHTDSDAAGLARDVNARAFAVGEHVAFGAGEYRPGTPVGDALIAHELAHTIQQQGASATSRDGGAWNAESLEVDADRSSASVLTTLWGNTPDTGGSRSAPTFRSGLRLSRCSPKAETPAGKTSVPDKPAPSKAEDPPPDPASSYWFEDPKKQVKDEDGAQEMDFTKKKGTGGPEITTREQTRSQVVVDKPTNYSKVGSVIVRFAYSASGFSGGKESAQITAAKTAVLTALAGVIKDIDSHEIGPREWSNKEEERKVRAEKKAIDEDRARMKELFKGFTADKPLNIYLAPETEREFQSGKYVPTTAQVWVSMGDVGDAAKLKTAMRIPLHHILGGANPAQGGAADAPADMKRTLIHESLHALLLNRGADSDVVWKQAQTQITLTGPDAAQKKTMDLIRAYVLAQEELFAYSYEERMYAPVTSGPQQSGKVIYQLFMTAADRFFANKKAAFEVVKKKLDVAEKVDGKKVDWDITYKFPKSLALTEEDKSLIDMALMLWPLKGK